MPVFNPPRKKYSHFESLAFSPDGRLLAYVCDIGAWLVVFPVSVSTLTSVPRSDFVSVWDVQTGAITINIPVSKFNELVFSGNCRTITILESCGTFSAYNGVNGAYICKSELPTSTGILPGAHWAYEESFRVFTNSESDGKLTVNIQEPRLTSTPPFHVVESFTVPPHGGEFSFSHVFFHASSTTGRVVILDL